MVEQKNRKTPGRDEFEAAKAGHVIGRAALMAARAHGLGAAAAPHVDLDAEAVRAKPCLLVDEARKVLTLIEKADQLHATKPQSERHARPEIGLKFVMHVSSFPSSRGVTGTEQLARLRVSGTDSRCHCPGGRIPTPCICKTRFHEGNLVPCRKSYLSQRACQPFVSVAIISSTAVASSAAVVPTVALDFKLARRLAVARKLTMFSS